jgi:hypothetical protein
MLNALSFEITLRPIIAKPAVLEGPDGFSDGRALVSENNGDAQAYRFIDRAGKAAFPGRFAAAAPFRMDSHRRWRSSGSRRGTVATDE